MARVSNLDEFLHIAFSAGVPDEVDRGEPTEAMDVPANLRRRVIERASTASSDFLAEKIIEAGRSSGWSRDELAYEAIDHEREALRMLTASGDPRDVSALGLARLFNTVGLEPEEWESLLTQTTARFVRFPSSGSKVLGRTTGLSPDERARALGGEVRDPVRARRIARNFVEEVTEVWMTLRSGSTRDTEDDL
jgi:hypothetical protein